MPSTLPTWNQALTLKILTYDTVHCLDIAQDVHCLQSQLLQELDMARQAPTRYEMQTVRYMVDHWRRHHRKGQRTRTWRPSTTHHQEHDVAKKGFDGLTTRS